MHTGLAVEIDAARQTTLPGEDRLARVITIAELAVRSGATAVQRGDRSDEEKSKTDARPRVQHSRRLSPTNRARRATTHDEITGRSRRATYTGARS